MATKERDQKMTIVFFDRPPKKKMKKMKNPNKNPVLWTPERAHEGLFEGPNHGSFDWGNSICLNYSNTKLLWVYTCQCSISLPDT